MNIDIAQVHKKESGPQTGVVVLIINLYIWKDHKFLDFVKTDTVTTQKIE